MMRAYIFIGLLTSSGLSIALNPGHLQQLYESKVCYGCDLTGANLQNWDLSNMRLSGSDLSYANLRGAILSNTDLSGVNFSGATWINGAVCRQGSIGQCFP